MIRSAHICTTAAETKGVLNLETQERIHPDPDPQGRKRPALNFAPSSANLSDLVSKCDTLRLSSNDRTGTTHKER